MAYPIHVSEETFDEVEVLGKPMLFTCARVDKTTIPKGLYFYEVRHDDDQRGDPVQIARWVMVNHWGCLLSATPIALEESPHINNAYRDIDPEKDWNYTGERRTAQEYMAKYLPKKNKEKDYER